MKADELTGRTVWIAETQYDYEGSTFHGVFATRRRAEKWFEELDPTCANKWKVTKFGSTFSPATMTSYEIRKYVIDEGEAE